MSVVSVVVADHSEPWRSLIFLILKENRNLQIIGVASDGREAVQKAEKLQPELIVMDLNLPNLNGIDAARQIRRVAPQCKILFLSRESDPDVAHAALREGARGYVLKLDLVRDLATAVESVIQGKQFVSYELAGFRL